jgi:hypothetical protein
MKEWFAETSSLEGILTKCAEHLARPSGGVRYLPGARLVKAFTQAKMGLREQAVIELEAFLREYNEGEEARHNLFKALDLISSVVP